METETRYAALEFRADSAAGEGPGRLVGVAMRYRDVAELAGWREQVEPGAFGDVAGLDVLANVQHARERPIARTGPDGGLRLTDSRAALAVEIDLPPTREGADVAELFRRRVLRGISVEMRVEREVWDGDLRTVRAAELVGLAVVDRPAYGAATAALVQRAAAERERSAAPAFRLWEWLA